MSEQPTRRQFLQRAGRWGLGTAGLVLLGGCAVRPEQGRGAPAARVATIGYLAGTDPESPDDADLNLLRQGLHELGWIEGDNLRLEVRSRGSDVAEMRDQAAELVQLPVDLIVAVGSMTIAPAVAATSTLPLVMVLGPPDLVERGVVASIQRPGGNLTGVLGPPYDTYGKRLELLLEAAPRVARVACMVSAVAAIEEVLRETARTLGAQVDLLTLRNDGDLESAFTAIDREAVGAVLVQQTPITGSHRAQIVAFLAQRRLPAIYGNRGWVEAGGVMSYSSNRAESFRRGAFYVDRILRGAQLGDLPIEYPTHYELVINLRTATALGIAIPDALLAQASEVIR